MVTLGVLNSRMKDFYDIWVLLRTFDFEGVVLAEAIMKAFSARGTPLKVAPEVFTESFAKESAKIIQWRGFIDKAKIAGVPESFEQIAKAIRVFLEPINNSISEGRRFKKSWSAPGPWT